MNPQNGGEQIRLRHSSLWRAPYSYQKPVAPSDSCHKQLNDLGATGVSWRSRNNLIVTNSDRLRNRSSLVYKTNSQELTELLQEKNKFSNLKRSMIRSLKPDADSIDRSGQLIAGMQELERIGLLTGRELQKTKFPGIIKHEHIYNDYHERVANPGFSRNYLGKFYTK